jgi:glycosyltransferase involved in cell wall biosynthesis
LPAVASDRPNPFDEPTAVFMGSLNSIWERDVLFDAATLLKAQGHRIPMTIIGGGRELPKWQAYIVEHGLEQVHLTGYLPDPEMISHLRHAHVLMFPIADTPANRARCPFKVFQYAQTGRPILTCRVGEVANLLEEKGVYAECDADDFAAKLRELMAQPDLPPIDYRLDRHTWDDRAARFIAAVEA